MNQSTTLYLILLGILSAFFGYIVGQDDRELYSNNQQNQQEQLDQNNNRNK